MGSSWEDEDEADDLTKSYWMPLNFEDMSKSAIEKEIKSPDVKRLDLPQISQKNILHRKADIDDFKACVDAPTVL